MIFLYILCLIIPFQAINADENQREFKNRIQEVLPESFDWRDQGAVLPRGQLGVLCDAAWAFAIAATVESHLFIQNGSLVQMSPQYIIDCCSFSDGCNVQVPLEKAYSCLARNNGVSSTSNYVYFNGIQGKCLNSPNLPISYESWLEPSEADMQKLLVEKGPLTVMVDAANLRSYSTGIVKLSECEPEVKSPLAMIIIGYGTENDEDYWIISNWWGENWGEGGYFKLIRNQNACGVNREVYIPIISALNTTDEKF